MMAPGNPPRRAHGAKNSSVKGRCVVLFSSDRALSDLLKANLERSGFAVRQQTWVQVQALAAEHEGALDLLLADVDDAAEHACFEAVAGLRKRFAARPLLVLAHEWPDARRLQTWQPCRYVRKPFAVGDVLGALEQLIADEPSSAR